MPYFQGTPTGPLQGGVVLPVGHPPIVGSPVNLGMGGFMSWVGKPEQGTMGKAVGYGALGLSALAAGHYIPAFLTDFPRLAKYGNLGRGIVFVLGGWTLYRAAMNAYASLPSGVKVQITGFGDILDKIRDWTGIPRVSDNKVAAVLRSTAYGVLGIGMWAASAYVPWPPAPSLGTMGAFFVWPLRLAKIGLLAGGVFAVYRGLMNAYGAFRGPTEEEFLATTNEAQKTAYISAGLALTPEEAMEWDKYSEWREDVSSYTDELWKDIEKNRGWDVPWLTFEEAKLLQDALDAHNLAEKTWGPGWGLPFGTLKQLKRILQGAPYWIEGL